MSVEVDDRALKKALAMLKEELPSIKIGVLPEDAGKKHPNADATIGEVAVWNEYGTETIPARSWLFDFIDENMTQIQKQLAADTLRIINTQEEPKPVLTKRGKEYLRRILRRIKNSIPPPNAPATLRRKKGTTTLIDTGVLLKHIRFKVD